jgi:AcrR family transcriptional regulator
VRSPTQARSRTTVEAIVEAATRILYKEGMARLNTNLVAERAGTSIGTLYQYFPNKEAILLTIAKRQLDQDRGEVMATISAALEAPDAELERVIIRKAIDLYLQNTETRRALMQTLVTLGREEEATRTMQDVIAMLSDRVAQSPASLPQKISPTMIFIVAHAVEGAIRAAAYGNRALLMSRAFEDELVRLVRSYLRPDAAPERGSS